MRKTKIRMLYRKTIDIYCGSNMEHTEALRGQSVKFLVLNLAAYIVIWVMI